MATAINSLLETGYFCSRLLIPVISRWSSVLGWLPSFSKRISVPFKQEDLRGRVVALNSTWFMTETQWMRKAVGNSSWTASPWRKLAAQPVASAKHQFEYTVQFVLIPLSRKILHGENANPSVMAFRQPSLITVIETNTKNCFILSFEICKQTYQAIRRRSKLNPFVVEICQQNAFSLAVHIFIRCFNRNLFQRYNIRNAVCVWFLQSLLDDTS